MITVLIASNSSIAKKFFIKYFILFYIQKLIHNQQLYYRHFFNYYYCEQQQLMYDHTKRNISYQQFFIHNSINDDSFLRQLLESGQFNNQFHIKIQTDANSSCFVKQPSMQNLNSPSFSGLTKINQTSVQQVLKQSSQKQNRNLGLRTKYHDEENSSFNESNIMDQHGKQGQQDEQKEVITLSKMRKEIDEIQPNVQRISSLILVQTQGNKYQMQQMKAKQQQQNKMQKQILLQQQKEKLEKLREQNQKFIQFKKQKDKKIKEFQNQLQNLNKIKQKQVIKNQQNIKLQQIQALKKNQKKFYQAIMQQKLAINKILSQKENQSKSTRTTKEQTLKTNTIIECQKKPLKKATLLLKQVKKDDSSQQTKKINQIRELLSRRNSYQQKKSSYLENGLIRQKNVKPVKQQSEMQRRSSERRLNVKCLSAAQIYRMGQEFMQEAHQLISSELIEKSKLSFDKRTRQISDRTEYNDYLKESKAKRALLSQSTGKLSSNPEIRELRKLIVREQNSHEKLLKAKLISGRFDQKLPIKANTRLKADSIAVKLKIIEEFS